MVLLVKHGQNSPLHHRFVCGYREKGRIRAFVPRHCSSHTGGDAKARHQVQCKWTLQAICSCVFLLSNDNWHDGRVHRSVYRGTVRFGQDSTSSTRFRLQEHVRLHPFDCYQRRTVDLFKRHWVNLMASWNLEWRLLWIHWYSQTQSYPGVVGEEWQRRPWWHVCGWSHWRDVGNFCMWLNFCFLHLMLLTTSPPSHFNYFQFNTPFDVVKTRIQGHARSSTSTGPPSRYSWALPGLVTVAREEGLTALWRGFLPKVLRLGPGGGIMLVVFDVVSRWIRVNWMWIE